MLSWGVGVLFSKFTFSHGFLKIIPKVLCLKHTGENWPFFQILMSRCRVGVCFQKFKISKFSHVKPKVWVFSL